MKEITVNKKTENHQLTVTIIPSNGLMSTTFRKSIYPSSMVKVTTWGKLVKQLSSFYKVADKMNLPAIVPCSWISNYEPSTHEGKAMIKNGETAIRRVKSNMKEQFILVLDIDGDGMSFDRFKRCFSKYFDFFMHTSSSHKVKAGGDRYRVLIPLKKPVTAQFLASRKHNLTEWFNSNGRCDEVVIDDKSTFSATRLFFLAGGERAAYKQYYKQAYNNNGKLMDLEIFKEDKPKGVSTIYSSRNTYSSVKMEGCITYYESSEEIQRYLDDRAEHFFQESVFASKNKGNKQSFSLACRLFKLGLPIEVAKIYLSKLQYALKNSSFDIEHQLNSVYKGVAPQIDLKYIPKKVKTALNSSICNKVSSIQELKAV